ncbi:EAL domain-containing protein [Phreatobacter cathodiphilus]|uniref:Diguanylate phosphodiesterase n=1 Tax=Phreatobacter cathodiphilus TaxID=1868589 RepID=A0A2S0NEV0_9HYPH|nr:EAL domain-containing protein [Phreatobacter cathodiphilus]AVO46471.1 diguanylate phosphodiesterase [Phreatobacter cathodiphilus]
MSCAGCRDGRAFPLAFSMAFQPIVHAGSGEVFAYEALVRGAAGEGAATVLGAVDAGNRYAFDQQCRVKAIELAAAGAPASARLSINFMPNAVYEPRACIRLTLATAERVGFPLDRIIFEFTENEQMDPMHVADIVRTYRDIGFATAIDDFGAGHAGLGLLTRFQPDIVKLDMNLIRDIDTDGARRILVRHTLAMLADLGITTICEGVETPGELAALRDLGVDLIQGYVLARPAFERFEAPRMAA